MKKKLLLFFVICTFLCQVHAQKNGKVNTSVEKVYVVFKTHLDVGFTELPSIVTRNYVSNFIPKALDISGYCPQR